MNIDFIYGDIVHSVQISQSTNRKITVGLSLTLQTFHFSMEQIREANIRLDARNCFNCPLSFAANNGNTGGCYTHRGDMFKGIISKMKRLNRALIAGKIPQYNSDIFAKIVKVAPTASFLRFGAYGEAVTMPEELTEKLAGIFGRNRTGYTHLWNNEQYQWAKDFFMASTDGNKFLSDIAQNMGWRYFNIGEASGIQCPSDPTIQKEKRVPCERCNLCGGASKKAKNIWIKQH